MPNPAIPSVFPNLATAAAELRQDRILAVAETYFPDVQLSDGYIQGKLRAAEREVERALRCWLTPREVVPDGWPEAELEQLWAAGHRTEFEPGYDFEPRNHRDDAWGLINLRQKPVIAVHHIRFQHPAAGASPAYDLPKDWMVIDRKYGRINLVPMASSSAMTIPLNYFVMGALGAGRMIPLMLRIRYRAGLEDAADNWPDLLDVIQRQALLNIMGDKFLPASASTSGDGLSQSISWDPDKHASELDAKIEKLRKAIHGIRLMVV